MRLLLPLRTGAIAAMTLLLLSFFNLSEIIAQERFQIGVESVNETHPNFGDTFPVVYTLDGSQGATITLIRGFTYEFEVDASGHPFFLSVQEEFNGYEGEITDGVTNSRLQEGILTFTPDETHPDVVWYQCGFHANMGASLNIVDAPESPTTFIARLSGASEVPPVFTTASGSVTAELDGNELTITGNFAGLSAPIQPVAGTGVHIHTGFTGQNGPVAVHLDPTLSDGNTAGSFNETVTLSTAQILSLTDRALYVNIHSETYPSGELRGQLLPAGQTYFQAYASGGYEVPANISTAQGGLSLEFDGDRLVVTGSFNGLTGDYIEVGNTGSGAHLHVGFAGQNGGVEISLTPDLSEDMRNGIFRAEDNTFENVPAEIVERLANRGHYLNIHSEAYPAGEIRGQILPQADVYFYAPLSGVYEIPQNNSQGTGAVLVEWYGDTSEIVVTGSFAGLESDYNTNIGSHFHRGFAGQNGGVDLVLTPELATDSRGGTYLPSENTFTLEADEIGRLVSRGYYVNIHSTDLPAGELRGQVLPLAQHYFYAALTGTTEVEPVETDAFGGVALEFRNGSLTISGSFSDLSGNYIGSPGSHIHEGFAGENGGVLFAFDPELSDPEDARSGVFAGADNTFTLDSEQIVQLVTGGLYVNVHSQAFPPGEIRGQILLAPNVAPAPAPGISFPANDAMVLVEGSAQDLFTPQWTASEDADDDRVVYIWQLALDADFDNIVVNASAGENAEISLPIGAVLDLLDELGVMEGSSATVWHRAIATDGSALTFGEGSSVTLERGTLTSTESLADVAGSFRLEQNFPNPFNPTTSIRYEIPESGQVSLRVYNTLGQQVATLVDGIQQAGSHAVQFNGNGLSSGMYIYRLESGGQMLTGTMLLVK